MFKHATKNDINEIMSITKKAIKYMEKINLDQWDETYPSKEVFLNDLHNDNLFIYLKNDCILGFCVINQEVYPEYQQVTWSREKEFKTIHRFCINPDFFNRNIGYEMMNSALNLIKEMNVDYVKIDTYSKNIAMNKLVKKCGFNYLGQMDLKPGKSLWNCYDINLYDINKALKTDDIGDLIILAANCVFDNYSISDNLECSRYLFSKEGCKFSYENSFVIKEDNKIIAMFIIYDSKDEKKMAKKEEEFLFDKYERTISVVDDESVLGTYYLDTLSVSKEYQNTGISKLIFSFVKRKYKRISLLVEKDNENAFNAYQKQGFKVVNEVEKFDVKLYQMIYE